MLTIRHVRRDGTEGVFVTDNIERTADGLVFGRTITEGKVYVMNDLGKTVAIFDCDQQKQKRLNDAEKHNGTQAEDRQLNGGDRSVV